MKGGEEVGGGRNEENGGGKEDGTCRSLSLTRSLRGIVCFLFSRHRRGNGVA